MVVNSPGRGLVVFTAFIYKLLTEGKLTGKAEVVSAHNCCRITVLVFPCLSLRTKLLEIHRIDLQHLSPYSGLFSSSTSPLPTLQHTSQSSHSYKGSLQRRQAQHFELIQSQKQRLHVTKYLN